MNFAAVILTGGLACCPRRSTGHRKGASQPEGRCGTADIFHDAQHPHTWGLLGSVPRLDLPRPARLPRIPGQPAVAGRPPVACVFLARCPHRFDAYSVQPPLVAIRLLAPPGAVGR